MDMSSNIAWENIKLTYLRTAIVQLLLYVSTLLQPEDKQTATNINIITIALLVILTVLAAVTKDLGLVNAVGGGSLATLIVFVFPAMMFWAAIDHRVAPPTGEEKREIVFAMILMILGLIMGAIGVVVAII
jgi:cytochrome c biogenesis factor